MRGVLLLCAGILGLGWLWHLLVLLVQPLSCKGLPFSLPSLHPSRPALGKASGCRQGTVSTNRWCWWVFH